MTGRSSGTHLVRLAELLLLAFGRVVAVAVVACIIAVATMVASTVALVRAVVVVTAVAVVVQLGVIALVRLVGLTNDVKKNQHRECHISARAEQTGRPAGTQRLHNDLAAVAFRVMWVVSVTMHRKSIGALVDGVGVVEGALVISKETARTK